MDLADGLDRLLRRNPLLPRAQGLRALLRGPYHRLMRRMGESGFRLDLGRDVSIRVPVEYCSREIEGYEAETVAAIAAWARANPGGLFVDIGCSFGYISCAVRFLDPAADVVAVDADLASLEVTRRMCRYAPRGSGSLTLVLGLVDRATSEPFDLNDAAHRTAQALAAATFDDAGPRINYVCLDSSIGPEVLPRTTLDDLLGGWLADPSRPCLVKCDVEGAEETVLRGAGRTLASGRCRFLISVHPWLVERFGGSVEGVREIFEDAGYVTRVLGIDHEEHWLCEPADMPPLPTP